MPYGDLSDAGLPTLGTGNALKGSPPASWQWQPSLTEHDPNPPIVIEDGQLVAFRRAWTTGPAEQETVGPMAPIPWARRVYVEYLVDNPATTLFGYAVTMGVFETREFARIKRPWLLLSQPVVATTGIEVALYRRARTAGPMEQEAQVWSRKQDVGIFVTPAAPATQRQRGYVIG